MAGKNNIVFKLDRRETRKCRQHFGFLNWQSNFNHCKTNHAQTLGSVETSDLGEIAKGT